VFNEKDRALARLADKARETEMFFTNPDRPGSVFRLSNSPTSALKHRQTALILVLIIAFVASSILLGRPPSSSALTNNGSITSFGSPITENFDTLASGGTNPITWTDNSTIPGWYSTRITYNFGTGSSNAGAQYSFGAAAAADRALGTIASGSTLTIFFAARLINNTGGTITSLDINYIGEQWRNGGNTAAHTLAFQYQVADAGTITDADTPSTGWTPFASLDFTGPINTATAGALDGNAAANRTAKSANLPVSVNNGQEIWLRWRDPDDAGADHGLAVDDLSISANGGAATPPVVPTCPPTVTTTSGTPTSAPVSATDADGTVTSAAIISITPTDPGTITLSGFVPAGTPGGTATANLLVGALTPAGNYNVTIRWSNNDPTPQTGDCTVAVTVLAPVALTPIHDIQGSGSSSPLVGTTVSTTGIVTGLKGNGFFIQEPDATVDANPATSEGIFVFTSSAPPVAAALGNRVQVTGTVAEFIPSADPFSPPLTEISGSPSVAALSTGNPLPAPFALTALFPDPAGLFDQLERLEGMRVSASSFTVVGPTDGNVSEPNATSTSNGIFYGTVTGVARPFREPGIQAPDPPPAGTIPPIPRFDTNPERIKVDSDVQPGSAKIDVATGQVLTGLVGPLDYSFRAYTILPDAASPPSVTGSLGATPVPIPAANQFTVASFNLERFFDTVNDPGVGDPVLTATAFANRLNKASLAIRNVARTPDILGVVEIENLTTLQALATKISTDAIAAGQPDPNYQAYLVEGNDVGGIDVGFLVKSPRVSVVGVTQEGAATTWIDPDDNQPALLNDRPPLVLRATVDGYAITVIVNHLRSFLGIESNAPDGLTTEGNRVRQKRKAQAEFLANLVQARQVADPAERIVLVGDFNAFQFNDGYVDVMGGIKGTPVPAGEAVLQISDLVNPDLTSLVEAVTPTQRYSYVFEGNAQVLDHVLVTSNVNAQLFYARNDADFPETFRNDPTRPERISDHDIPVAYFDLVCQITCPANISVPGEPAQCGATVSFSTTDIGCAEVTCTPASGSFFPVGTTTVTCSENESSSASAPTDAAGVAPGSSCSFTVTVTDTETPVITCPANIAVSTDLGQCSTVVTFAVSAADNCTGPTVIANPPSGSTFPKGTTTVTATATDASGNTASCSFTVTVVDTQPPIIVCPSNRAAIAPGSCGTVNYPVPVATDNCPGVGVSCLPASGTCFPVGTATVTCVATDSSGNTATCSFTITVFDVCLQDDSDASRVVLVNSSTGDYRFCCGGTTYSGRGTVSVRGSIVTLEDNSDGLRVSVKVHRGIAGTASLHSPPGKPLCIIRDRNTADNLCACQ
jgi:hypothetical protein